MILKELSLADFGNFGYATACSAKLARHKVLALKLRSTTSTINFLSKKVIENINISIKLPHIEPISIDNIDINLASGIDKLSNPKQSAMPDCLNEAVIDIKIPEAKIPSFDGVFSTVGKGLNYVMQAQASINDKINKYSNDANAMILEANKMIENMYDYIMDPLDYALFISLDVIKEIIERSNFVDDYIELREIEQCIATNCPRMVEKLTSTSFLWNEDRTKFSVPIDIGTGRLKINKFSDNTDPDEIKATAEIESRYYLYLKNKRELIKRSEELMNKASNAITNPFSKLLSNAGY